MQHEHEWIQNYSMKYLKTFLISIESRRPHTHRDLEIGLILEGSIRLKVDHEEKLLEKHDLYLINPHQVHSLSAPDQRNEILIIQLSPKLCQPYFPRISQWYFDSFWVQPENTKALALLCCRLAICCLSHEKGFELEAAALANLLLFRLFQTNPPLVPGENKQLQKSRVQRLEPYLYYIDEHYKETLSLSDLAKQSGLSLYYLSHLFTDILGMSFRSYLAEVRFEHALVLLNQTHMKILDICLESGFSSGKYLDNMVKKKFGITLKEYRKRPREKEQPLEQPLLLPSGQNADQQLVFADLLAVKKLLVYLSLRTGNQKSCEESGCLNRTPG